MRSRRLFRTKLEFAGAGLATNEGKAQEVEVSGLPSPRRRRRSAARRPNSIQPGLLGMQRQRKLPQPLAHLVQKAPGVTLVWKRTM